MKILIGVDESECSKAAVETVKSLKWPDGTSCMVLSAVESPVIALSLVDLGGGLAWMQNVEEVMVRQAEERVSRLRKELEDAGLHSEGRVERGDARRVLVEAGHAFDLLVVGSHGRTGLDKLLMGSVASHVVGHAPCSVLVVKRRKGA